MNNQAAQTMPPLVYRVRECHAAWAAYNAVAPGEDRAVGTEKLLTEVLAALSQPAGVPDGWRTEIESILSDAARGGPPVGRDWCCLDCGRWTPINHPEAHAHEDDCTSKAEWNKRLNWKARLHIMLTAAPAASGGEVDHG